MISKSLYKNQNILIFLIYLKFKEYSFVCIHPWNNKVVIWTFHILLHRQHFADARPISWIVPLEMQYMSTY